MTKSATRIQDKYTQKRLSVVQSTKDPSKYGIVILNPDGSPVGGGNVKGPNGAVDDDVVLFDGNTGKKIKDSGVNLRQKQDKLTAGTDMEINITPGGDKTETDNNTLLLSNAVSGGLKSLTAYGGGEEIEEIPGYTILEYIDGGGTDSVTRTYIDTGITPVANTLRIKYKGKLLGEAYGGSFIGAVTGTVPRAGFRYFCNANNGDLCIQTYSYTYNIPMGFNVFDTDITVDNVNKTLTGYVNSTILNETSANIDLNFNKNMLMHGIYLGDTVSTGTLNRCYYCLIEKNGVTVRDFVPVIRNSDNAVGYYDKVSETFFANQGPGTFTAGPVKAPRKLRCNNGELKVRTSIADFSSGLIRRSTNTLVSVSSTKCGIEYTFRTSAGYIGKVFPVTVGNTYTINYGSKSSSTGSSTSIFFIELDGEITKIDDNYGVAIACPYTFKATKPYVGIWLGYPNVVSGTITINVSGLTLIEGGIPANTIYTEGDVETIEDEFGNTATTEMLMKVNEKADTQEILSGAITRNVRVLVFDGSETFTSSKTGSTYRYTFDISDYPQYVDGVSSRGSVLSTHFISIHSSSVQTPGGTFTYNGGANNKKLYFIPSDQTLTTVDLFKQWVDAQYRNGTPLIAMYPLDTGGTETVDGQEMNVKGGDNEIEITQASISTLQLGAVYESGDINTIAFKNDTGYITLDEVPEYTAGTGISINDYVISTDGSGGNGDVMGPDSSTDGHLAVFDGTTGKLLKDGGAIPQPTAVVDDLTSTSTTSALSANQGKVLKDKIDDLMAMGKFLSLWNGSTGLPISFPLTTPYTYSTGDYFMVETLDADTNYRPNGSSYSGTASSVEETGEVCVGDYYVYDGSVWLLASNHGKTVSFSNLAGQPSDNANLTTALNGKQNSWVEVTVSTASSTAAKVGSTAGGSYTPTKGDLLLVNFVNGNNATSAMTLKIDNGSAIGIKVGENSATATYLPLGNTSASNIKILMYYDGTYYKARTTTNTTYTTMSVSEGQTGTATSSRVITAATLKSLIKYHSVSDTAFGSGWDGVTDTAPSKNAVYDMRQAINDVKVGSTAPSTPTEGMVWYDTANDKLKAYDGSNWIECGTGGGGSGDVSGPASSTDGDIAIFDGATGKVIEDSGVGLSDLARTNQLTVVSGDSGVTYTLKVSNSEPASGTPNTTITFVTD